MPLKGDVSSLSLLDLFQTLALTNKRGTLKVVDGQSMKVIYFGMEGVCLISRGARKQSMLGLRMVQQGLISREELDAALREQEGTNYRLGEILTLQGKVEPKTLETVLRQQVEDEIFDLLTWPKATFEFREGDMEDSWFDGDDHRQLKLFFNVNDLLLEAARRADEWRRLEKILPGPDSVIERAMDSDPGSPLWGRIDGQRTLRQVAEASGMSLLPAAQQVAAWIQEGLVQLPGTKEEPPPEARGGPPPRGGGGGPPGAPPGARGAY